VWTRKLTYKWSTSGLVTNSETHLRFLAVLSAENISDVNEQLLIGLLWISLWTSILEEIRRVRSKTYQERQWMPSWPRTISVRLHSKRCIRVHNSSRPLLDLPLVYQRWFANLCIRPTRSEDGVMPRLVLRLETYCIRWTRFGLPGHSLSLSLASIACCNFDKIHRTLDGTQEIVMLIRSKSW
jgi:hypothetical protein